MLVVSLSDAYRDCMQGSTLSTLLCSIFLGHLEQTHLLPLLSCKQTTTCSNGSSAASGPGLTDLAQAAGARLPLPGLPEKLVKCANMDSVLIVSNACRACKSLPHLSDSRTAPS